MGDLSRRARWVAAVAVTTVLVAGCGSSEAQPPTPVPLLLSAPHTDIIVTIPPGWHQVIDSASPATGEMVAPTGCMGDNETTCATALARIISLRAHDVQAAEQTIYQAVASSPGITINPTTAQGPGTVGAHSDGFIRRFSFSNPGATLTAAIAAVPSGLPEVDTSGNREFSVVLVWVANKPGAPSVKAIDDIVHSAKIGVPARSTAPRH